MDNALSKRHALCAQVAALFVAHDIPVNDKVMDLMAPLLNGRLDYAEHRAMLEAMMMESAS